MFGLEMLDVAIGVMFVYLLLSLICSGVCEWLEMGLRYRARDLEKGIRQLLGDKCAAECYNHPLIRSLFKGKHAPDNKRNYPSYIPARTFALALMDLVLPADAKTKSKSGAAYATPAETRDATSGAGTSIAAPLPSEAAGSPNRLEPLRTAIMEFSDSKVKKALIPLVDAAGDDVCKARENIEDWYNSTMDRVTGWYKRRTRIIALLVALLVTVVMNANTLTIADYLSRDATTRNLIVARAQETAKASAPPKETLDRGLAEVRELRLPIGWSDVELGNATDVWNLVRSHVLGWFITACAISLGASFWFDRLQNIIAIRSAVKPEEKGPEEKATQ